MTDIIELKKRIARKKRENTRHGFVIRDLRDSYFIIDNEYLNGYARVLGPIASMVYISLCRHASKEQICYPGYGRIATELGISRTTVWKAIGELERHGLVRVDRRGGEPNVYTLTHKRNWRKAVGYVTESDLAQGKATPLYCAGCKRRDSKECAECHVGSMWIE